MKLVTNRDFSDAIAEALGHKLKPATIEQVRRALVKDGLLQKSLGKNLVEITTNEAALFCIAIVLPFSIPANIQLLKEIKAIPNFIGELAQYIKNSASLDGVTVGAKRAVITVNGIDKHFGKTLKDSEELASISVQISKTVFSVARAELQNLKIDSGEMISEEE